MSRPQRSQYERLPGSPVELGVNTMIAIVMMLLLLVASYLALAALTYFCEDVIAPASTRPVEPPAAALDGKEHQTGS
jgi:hypothetical protein